MTYRKVIEYYQEQSIVGSYDKQRFSTLGGKLVDEKERKIVLDFVSSTRDDSDRQWILDLGTGTGRVAKWFKGDKRIGVDSSIAMLRKAKKEGLEVICCDILHLPFHSAVFSLVVAIRVFIRVNYLLPFFDEVARVLRNKSWFIFDTSNKPSVGHILRSFAREPPHTSFAKKEVQSALKITSFSVAEAKPCFLLPRGLYQKINETYVLKLWHIDNMLLESGLCSIASTFFWKAQMTGEYM